MIHLKTSTTSSCKNMFKVTNQDDIQKIKK